MYWLDNCHPTAFQTELSSFCGEQKISVNSWSYDTKWVKGQQEITYQPKTGCNLSEIQLRWKNVSTSSLPIEFLQSVGLPNNPFLQFNSINHLIQSTRSVEEGFSMRRHCCRLTVVSSIFRLPGLSGLGLQKKSSSWDLFMRWSWMQITRPQLICAGSLMYFGFHAR